MSEIERLIAEQEPQVAAAIDEIINMAGTQDADWQVLLAAGRLLAAARCGTKIIVPAKGPVTYPRYRYVPETRTCVPCDVGWDSRYRRLDEGEIVEAGDEALGGGWHNDNEEWTPVRHCIGRAAPNPLFPAHTVYRRLIGNPAQRREGDQVT